MADGRYVVTTVQCSLCKAKQKIHVAARVGFGQMGHHIIRCINCEKYFDVMVPDKIIRGPFPA